MLTHERSNIDRNARTAAGRKRKSATKISVADTESRSASEREFPWPEIDQGRLTIVSLWIIAVLLALNFVLRFPELGALIAPLNQF